MLTSLDICLWKSLSCGESTIGMGFVVLKTIYGTNRVNVAAYWIFYSNFVHRGVCVLYQSYFYVICGEHSVTQVLKIERRHIIRLCCTMPSSHWPLHFLTIHKSTIPRTDSYLHIKREASRMKNVAFLTSPWSMLWQLWQAITHVKEIKHWATCILVSLVLNQRLACPKLDLSQA